MQISPGFVIETYWRVNFVLETHKQDAFVGKLLGDGKLCKMQSLKIEKSCKKKREQFPPMTTAALPRDGARTSLEARFSRQAGTAS